VLWHGASSGNFTPSRHVNGKEVILAGDWWNSLWAG
jgi:hypothetical protein